MVSKPAEYLVSAGLLIALPLAILVGPRITLPLFDSGEFRVQDFLLAATICCFGILDLFGQTNSSPRIRLAFWLFVGLAALSMLYALDPAGGLFQALYSLRLLQVPLIALVVFRSLEALRGAGVKIIVGSIASWAVLNLLWVAYQFFSNRKGPLWAVDVPYYYQYGPGLMGDGAPFPSGQVLVILLAGVASLALIQRARRPPCFAKQTAMVFIIWGSVVVTESRISILTGGLIVALWVAVGVAKIVRVFPPVLPSLVVAAVSASVLVASFLPRISWASIESGIRRRVEDHYLPILRMLEESFWFGLGPGSIRAARDGVEYHSLYFGLLADFGFVGLIVALGGIFLLIRTLLDDVSKSVSPVTRVFALWSLLVCFNLLLAGAVQESHIAAAPNHLAAVVSGTYFWLKRRADLAPRFPFIETGQWEGWRFGQLLGSAPRWSSVLRAPNSFVPRRMYPPLFPRVFSRPGSDRTSRKAKGWR